MRYFFIVFTNNPPPLYRQKMLAVFHLQEYHNMLLLLLFYSTKTWTIFPGAGIPDNSVCFNECQRQLTVPFVQIPSQGHCT